MNTAAPTGGAGHPPAGSPLSILCVDDEQNILNTLRRLFRTEDFQVLTATSGQEGLAILKHTEHIGLILSDQRMPEMTGAAFLREARELYPDIPRMILTGYTDVSAAIDAINHGGAYRFLTKPWNEHELRQAVRDGLYRYRLTRENQRLNELVRRQNAELAEWNTNLKNRVLQQTAQLREKLRTEQRPAAETVAYSKKVVESFFDLLALRNSRLTRHIRTVTALADRMARELDLDALRREEIRMAALLHDIGMIGMPDRLLTRNSQQVNPDELAEYRAHPVWGEAALAKFEELRVVGQFIRHHHEAFDGSGFPDGLAGEKIPLGARIIALADWIDTTFSRESRSDARYHLTKQMAREMGRLFDPALAAAANVAVIQVLRDPPMPKDLSEEKLPVTHLREGMVLSRDVYSKTGLLLVERRTRLYDTEIEILNRYLGGDLSQREIYVLKSSIGDGG